MYTKKEVKMVHRSRNRKDERKEYIEENKTQRYYLGEE
jgi:hypothetical protein